MSFANPFISILGVDMHFGVKQINDLYRLPDVDMAIFESKGCASGSWIAEKLC